MRHDIRNLLSGQDSPTQTALPAGEFLHPLPMVALAMLVANDWWLKPSSWAPSLLTGKLSDFAGLLFFPLLLTALLDCLLLGLFRIGLPVDFSLRRWKLAFSLLGTGVLFSAIKLWPASNRAAIDLLGALGFSTQIVLDPSDLVALPVLWIAWRLGRQEIARLPLGRLEFLLHRRDAAHSVGSFLHDLVPCGAKASHVSGFLDALMAHQAHVDSKSEQALAESLARLRDVSPTRI